MVPPTISIIIAAYNAGAFITRAIASAQAQTRPASEIIVVDDGSTDDTTSVVRRLSESDPRIRLITLANNQGPGPARNAAIEAASGEWLAVLDADDVFAPDRLERLVALAEAYSGDVVADNLRYYDIVAQQSGRIGIMSIKANHVISLDEYIHNSHGRAKDDQDVDWGLLQPMFRRNFLNENNVRYPDVRHGEDFTVVLLCLLAGATYVFSPEVGYLYTAPVGEVSGVASGQSRTTIDYHGMADHTIGLLSLPAIKANPDWRLLLEKRISVVRRMDAEYRMELYARERRPLQMLRLLATHPYGVTALSRVVAGKARAEFSRLFNSP